MRAIAAMARNRVIGRGGEIPWRIPEEFRWFRRATMGSFLVMGRRTFESLPKPLDGRITVVLTHDPEALRASGPRYAGAVVGDAALRPVEIPPGHVEVRLVSSVDALERSGIADRAWLCGGARVYAQFLDRCSELLLSVIDRDVEGDVLFPPFEDRFALAGVEAEFPEFRVLRYVARPPGA